MQLYETMVNNHGVHIHVTEVHRELRNEQSSLVIIPGLPSRPRIISTLWKNGNAVAQAYRCYYARGRGQSDSPDSIHA